VAEAMEIPVIEAKTALAKTVAMPSPALSAAQKPLEDVERVLADARDGHQQPHQHEQRHHREEVLLKRVVGDRAEHPERHVLVADERDAPEGDASIATPMGMPR
jgi:hypothetical protein